MARTADLYVVAAIATSNISVLNGIIGIDGYTIKDGDYIYLTAQSSAAQNGLYVIQGSNWVELPMISNSLIFVRRGNTYSGTFWVFESGVLTQVLTRYG